MMSISEQIIALRECFQGMNDILEQAEEEILTQDEFLVEAKRVIEILVETIELQEQSKKGKVCLSQPIMKRLQDIAKENARRFYNELKDHGTIDEEPSKET